MKADLFRQHAVYERHHWWFVARRRIVARLVRELVPPSRNHIIVDVGCGTGANVAEFARDYTSIGIDTSPDGIALAKKNFPDCSFKVGYAPEDLGDVAGRADMFLLMDVLEHVRDDVALFTGLMAAAKPGALALVTVPANPALWSSHDVVHMHYRRYTPERIRVLWEGAPLTPLLVTHFNTRLYPVVRLARALANARGRSVGEHGTDLSLPPAPINRMLTGVFAGETARLLQGLRHTSLDTGRPGVSLMAVVRRDAGPMTRRERPAELAASDLHDPERAA